MPRFQVMDDDKLAELDYPVNLKAELEIMPLHDRLDSIKDEVVTEITRLLPAGSEDTRNQSA